MPVYTWLNIAPRADDPHLPPNGVQRKLSASTHDLLGAAMSRAVDAMGAGIIAEDGRYLRHARQADALARAARTGNTEFALYDKASADENADEDTGLVARVYPCDEHGANLHDDYVREPSCE